MAGIPDLPGKEVTTDGQSHSVDLSPAATTVAFDPVIPLLRMPVPAGEEDDPSKGPYFLAFKNEETWRRAWHDCEAKIAEQCEAGARMGCSLSADKVCRPPWWQNLFPFFSNSRDDTAKREACEEQEMTACMAAAKDRCADFARDTCRPVFSEARIAESAQSIDSRFMSQNYKRVKRWTKKDAMKSVQRNSTIKPFEQDQCSGSDSLSSDMELRVNSKRTNFQGKLLLPTDASDQKPWEGPLWVDGTWGNMTETVKSSVDGWEGGLIRPKVHNQNAETVECEEIEPIIEADNSLWRQVEQRLKTKLEKLKF